MSDKVLYARLIEDDHLFKAGTEFIVEHQDDGFYTDEPFYSGTVTYNGGRYHIASHWDKVKLISETEYTGKVIYNKEFASGEKEDEWWEYTKYP